MSTKVSISQSWPAPKQPAYFFWFQPQAARPQTTAQLLRSKSVTEAFFPPVTLLSER